MAFLKPNFYINYVLLNELASASLDLTFECGDEEGGHVVPVAEVGVGPVVDEQGHQLGGALALTGHRHGQGCPTVLRS